MRILLPVSANVILVFAALGFGGLARAFFPKSFTILDRILFRLLAGLGILGTVLFCVGQVWFSRRTIACVLIVGILLEIPHLVRAFPRWRTILPNVSLPALPVAILCVILSVTAIGGLALPTGDLNNDAIAYHYLGPKVWLRQEVIRAVPDEVLTYFPVVIETQYAALMSLGGARAPGFFAVVAVLLTLFTTVSLSIRTGLGPADALWAAALVSAMPAVYAGSCAGFLDALFASFVLAATRLAFDSERRSHYALFGIFGGIMMGTKYTGILSWLLLLFCSLVIAVWARRTPWSRIIGPLLISCAVAAIVASPFYLRNWILYGCPIYPPPPLLLKFFTPKNFPPAVLQELVKNVTETGRGMGGGIWNLLLFPWHYTYHAADFRGAGGIGIAPLALAPFGFLARRRDVFALGLALFAFCQAGAWFFSAQVSRYLIQDFVIGAVFAVLGWQYVRELSAKFGRVLAGAVVAISLAYGLVLIVPSRSSEIHAVVSRNYEEKWRYQKTTFAASFDYINQHPAVKKVLVLHCGVAVFFLDKPYVKPCGRWGEQTLPGATSTAAVMRLLPSLQVTHILDVKSEAGLFELSDHPAGLTLVYVKDDQRVYRVD